MAAGLSGEASLRRGVGAVLLAYLVFVVYGSLVPLNFRPLPFDEALVRFAATPMLNLGIASRADLIANLLLFVPLAFLARERLVGDRRGPGGAGADAAIWLVCAALAVGIEFTQVFFPGRTVSQNDIAAEAAGAALGLLLHRGQGARLRRWLLGWWGQGGLPLAQRALVGYLVLLALFSVMPLDLTISPAEIWHKAQEGRVRVVPFADLPREPAALAYALLSDLVLWAPVGLLWRLSGHGVGAAVLRGALAAAVMEGLQLFVYSRVTSITSVLTGAAGCALGALLAPAAWRTAARPAAAQARAAASSATTPAATGTALPAWPWGGLTALWAATALLLFWYPFDFRLDPPFLAQRIGDATRLPFVTYYFASEFHALNELLRKMLVFLPGGLLWAARCAAAPAFRRDGLRRLGAFGLFAMAALVEGVQLALPGKVADLTDLVLEAAGGWLGLWIGARLLARPAVSAAGAAASRAPAPRPARHAPAPATAPPRRATLLPELAAVLALAAGLWWLARRPGVPYNVVELIPGSAEGALTALGLAAVAAWLFALPLWLQAWLRRGRHATLKLLAVLPLLGVPPALLLLADAPTESLEDVLGSPVLGWPPGLEMFGRYLALHGALALAAIGAAWLVRRLATGDGGGMLTRWTIATLVWALPVHLVVVTFAATDNLVELMRDGGGPLASALLFGGLLALFTGASALAALAAGAGRPRRLLAAAVLAWPLATWLLWLGSETALFKYDKLFSAAQFLLSADRDHYAPPASLLQRWALACAGFAGLVLLLQWPGWRRVRAAAPAPRR